MSSFRCWFADTQTDGDGRTVEAISFRGAAERFVLDEAFAFRVDHRERQRVAVQAGTITIRFFVEIAMEPQCYATPASNEDRDKEAEAEDVPF